MKEKRRNVLFFLKRNAVYIVLVLCILAVSFSIAFMVANQKSELELNNNPSINLPSDTPVTSPDDENVPVIKPIEFIMPVISPTAIGEYEETMVFNSTLNRYTAHLAMDFYAPEGSSVYAVYDGTVVSIENTFLQGTTITIDHGNGLFSIYNSLADGESVSVGQTVKQGDEIGQVSVTNRQEYKAGAHLHFEVKENGQFIDPAKYLETQEK
ncbi:MAG: M23 family metallopeptidase [Clostridiales bacterium]|nr:M23 family metallopeptidase [Clostridiales bacterium]